VKISDYVDERTGLPVYSLYGKTQKPTSEMLEGIDMLVYDIQDVGSRAYTYIYTMARGMEAAVEHGIPFVVLDRPNPLGGLLVEGPVLEPMFKSGIGMFPIPYVYGLTVGELASLFNEEFKIGCDLFVIPMEGWSRNMLYADTGLPWVPTSNHIPHAKTAIFFVVTGCIGELGICEGVGYTSPFEQVGTEWTDGHKLAEELNGRNLPGVIFRPLYFTPYYFRYQDKQIHGVHIHITDARVFRPMATQIHILTALKKVHPDKDIFATDRISSFYKAMGTDKVRFAIEAGASAEEIIASWGDDVKAFLKIREKYIIYKYGE
jgi:uncharacterized protein YbbC (DUF1343 family)